MGRDTTNCGSFEWRILFHSCLMHDFRLSTVWCLYCPVLCFIMCQIILDGGTGLHCRQATPVPETTLQSGCYKLLSCPNKQGQTLSGWLQILLQVLHMYGTITNMPVTHAGAPTHPHIGASKLELVPIWMVLFLLTVGETTIRNKNCQTKEHFSNLCRSRQAQDQRSCLCFKVLLIYGKCKCLAWQRFNLHLKRQKGKFKSFWALIITFFIDVVVLMLCSLKDWRSQALLVFILTSNMLTSDCLTILWAEDKEIKKSVAYTH